MDELQPEEIEELVQELEGESEEEEALSPEVEKLLRRLGPWSPERTRQDAAAQLGGVGTSSPQIVQALIAACESPSDLLSAAAAKSLRAPVHQEIFRQHPDLMQRAESAIEEAAAQRVGAGIIPSPQADRVGWGFWLLWILASAAGLALGAALESVFSIDLSAHMLLGEGTIGVAGALALPGGLVIGLAQWLILRQKLDDAGAWILASVPILVFGQLAGIQGGFTVRGLGVGLAQWLILRKHTPRAGLWIGACIIGWSIGLAVGNALFWEVGSFMANALFGAVTGAITGAQLIYLLNQRTQ